MKQVNYNNYTNNIVKKCICIDDECIMNFYFQTLDKGHFIKGEMYRLEIWYLIKDNNRVPFYEVKSHKDDKFRRFSKDGFEKYFMVLDDYRNSQIDNILLNE